MTMLEQPSREQRPPRRRRRALPIALALFAAVLAFLVGIAFSRALDERPSQGDPETTIRTLTSRPQEPPARTVTVTVTEP